MKRAQDPSPDDSSSRTRPGKRQKTVQSCSACKKSKTRCEVLSVSLNSPVQCHRCKALNNPCSYGDMDRSIFSHLVQPASSDSSSSPSLDPAVNSIWAAPAAPSPPAPTYFPRPDHLWSFVKAKKPIDWSAPLVAIQELAKQPFIPNGIPLPASDRCLDDVLSPAQKVELLETFTLHYLPWLNFPLIRDAANPLLDLVCCTIASRHLDQTTRVQVAPRLLKLTEDTVVKMIFNPGGSESLDSIQSLLILSLWSPICGNSESGIKDGKLLIASAVSMAMNLHINEAPSKVMDLHVSVQKDANLVDRDELDTLEKKARLWSSLLNIESMICLGTARLPLSRRTPADTYFIPMSSQSPATLNECRDLRIRLMSELFTQSEKARSIRIVTPTPTAVDSWYDGIADVLDTIDRLRRLIAPLDIVADYDNFHFFMLTLICHSSHLLVYYFATYDARMVFNEREDPSGPWFMSVRPHGLSVLITWGKESLTLAEAIIICVLRSDPTSLSTAPDHVFSMIGFAAGLIIGVKFLMLNKVGVEMAGSTDKLLSMAHNHLSKASISQEHSASRCAQLIAAMLETWQHRDKSEEGLHYTLPAIPLNSAPQQSSSSSPESHTPSTIGAADDGQTVQQQQQAVNDNMSWFGQDALNQAFNIFDDQSGFWTTFFAQGSVNQQFGERSFSFNSNFQYH